jgi:hypothetical protein
MVRGVLSMPKVNYTGRYGPKRYSKMQSINLFFSVTAVLLFCALAWMLYQDRVVKKRRSASSPIVHTEK